MAFTIKDWRDSPDATTPLSAAALEDLETRLSAWTNTRAAPRVLPTSATLATNIGATQSVTFDADERVWLIGTLNQATLAVTLTNKPKGAELVIVALQDATGNRAITVDGQSVPIPTTPSTGLAVVVVRCPDGTNLAIETNGVESDPFAILKTLVDAKGDLIVATAADTVARLAAGTDGYSLVTDAAQSAGVKWAPRSQIQTFSKTGAQTVAAGAVRFRFPMAVVIESVAATVGTAPTGATVIVDVNKNGTTIFTTQGNRPTIAISGNASSDAVPDVTSIATGDYLTVDVDQIGSTVAGSDLAVMIKYRLAA